MARSLTLSDLIDHPNGSFGMNGAAHIDLADAEPLGDAIAILDRAAAESIDEIYPLFWVNRVCASGGSVSVYWMPVRPGEAAEGPVDAGCTERLMIYEPCDEQMKQRRERIDAFRDHMRRHAGARDAVVRYANRSGNFSDARPFASPEEAVEAVTAAGIRLMASPQGELEPAPKWGADFVDRDAREGWPMKRAWHRFRATANRKGWEAEIINIIRDRGALHEGSGWIVLERKAA